MILRCVFADIYHEVSLDRALNRIHHLMKNSDVPVLKHIAETVYVSSRLIGKSNIYCMQ